MIYIYFEFVKILTHHIPETDNCHGLKICSLKIECSIYILVSMQVTQREVMEPNDPNTAKLDKDSWAFAYLINTRFPMKLQLGGLLFQSMLGPIYSWVHRINVSKVPCSRKQQHQIGITRHQTWNHLITRPML